LFGLLVAAQLDPDPLRYVTWGSKSLQSFDHLEDRNLALYEEILKEARSRFEPGKRLPRAFDSPVGGELATN
jgi:beta-ureidopropionase